MTDTDCAYLAGVIDGEGCIGVYRDAGTYKLVLTIVSTSVDWLIDLRSRWHGLGHIHIDKRPVQGNHKVSAQWTLNRADTQKILRKVLPYLGIKRSQAELALQFQALPRKIDKSTGRFTAIPESEKIFQARIADQLKRLKQDSYGKVVEPYAIPPPIVENLTEDTPSKSTIH